MSSVTAAIFNILALLALAEMERKIGVLPRLIALIRRVFGAG